MKETQKNCALHEQLIEQLLNENVLVKEKYESLLRVHENLRQKYKKLSEHCPAQIVGSVEKMLPLPPDNRIKNEIKATPGQSNTQMKLPGLSPKQDRSRNSRHSTNEQKLSKEDGQNYESFLKAIRSQQCEKQTIQVSPRTLRASSRSSRASSISQRFFPLIEGCFILEKKKCYAQKTKTHISEMLQFVYPQQLAKSQKQTLQILLKYTLLEPEPQKVYDDQFNSRRNEIMYGTPYEDYSFAFEDSKWVNKRELPEILKLMGTMKKKYYHVLIKPEILERDEHEGPSQGPGKAAENNEEGAPEDKQKQDQNYFYETEVIYGFISSFPLKGFFQDLHRTIQQELKYSQFTIDQNNQQVYDPNMDRRKKYSILGRIMKKAYDEELRLHKFPVQLTLNTGVTQIELNLPSPVAYREMQDEFLNAALHKHEPVKVLRLLHYILAQKCILVEAPDLRTLNELFEMMRILIRPFLWIFAIVYVYSQYFEPFMSSPMPIIIGKVSESSQGESEGRDKDGRTRQNSIEYSDFYVVRMDKQDLQLKQKEPFYKTLKKLKKQFDKNEKEKGGVDRATFIHRYVHNLRVFIEKGILNSEPTDFHIEFIDTQMVSYFKDTKQAL